MSKSVVDYTILNAICSLKREMFRGKTETLHLETACDSKRQFLAYRSHIGCAAYLQKPGVTSHIQRNIQDTPLINLTQIFPDKVC